MVYTLAEFGESGGHAYALHIDPTLAERHHTMSIHNHVLAALSAEDQAKLAPSLEHVNLRLHKSVLEPGGEIRHVYFVESGLIAALIKTDGQAAASWLIGCDAVLGISVVLGLTAVRNKHYVVVPGDAHRLAVELLPALIETMPTFSRAMLYSSAMAWRQSSQLAVCNARHSVRQRVARTILMALDRQCSNDLELTQEDMALILGARRAGVSEAMTALEATGSVEQFRGYVTVRNRACLERQSCSCYRELAMPRKADVIPEPEEKLPGDEYLVANYLRG